MQRTEVFAHDDNRGEGVGENLYFGRSSSGSKELAIQTTDIATRSWYEKEEFLYTYMDEYVPGTGHFTQVRAEPSVGPSPEVRLIVVLRVHRVGVVGAAEKGDGGASVPC